MAEQPNPIELQKYLQGMEYPADKSEIVEHAREHGADGNVMEFLEKIPDRQYDGPSGVSKELGGNMEDEFKDKTEDFKDDLPGI